MERILGRVRLALLRWLFPKLSEGVNLELLRRLSVLDFHNLMAGIAGPGVYRAQKTKKVFTGSIRCLVEPSIGDHIPAVVRNAPLKKRDIADLCEEMAVWLALAEQSDKFGYHIRRAFEHFFVRVRTALQVLADSAALAEEQAEEVEALSALADVLEDLFRHADLDAHLDKREAASRLKQRIYEWAARWYPEWERIGSQSNR